MTIISIHAPAGGATESSRSSGQHGSQFQFTPLREGRLKVPNHWQSYHPISIHAPAGGATHQEQAERTEGYNFNSRPCGRGDQMPQLERVQYLFQFTPLREGRPRSDRASDLPHLISIHAPAGGATRPTLEQTNAEIISIHAPAGGATMSMQPRICLSIYFNSRPCGRGDFLISS